MSVPARRSTVPVSEPGSAGPPGDGRSDARDERAGSARGDLLGRVGAEPDPRFTYANERTFLA